MVSYRIKGGRKEWYYQLDLPGSTKQNRQRDRKYGSLTKREAEAAEAQRKVELQRTAALENASLAPGTLDLLLEKFLALHCCGPQPLADKTTERYRELKAYLSPELLALAPTRITRLQFTQEWKRLLQSGGRDRWKKTSKPLSPSTVNHIADVVRIAYNWGAKQEFWTENVNPMKFSERPKIHKPRPWLYSQNRRSKF